MGIKTAKTIVLIIMLTVGGYSSANNALNARGFTCQELQQIIVEREKVSLRGFLGSRNTVHATAAGCSRYRRPTWTAWRTKDRLSCPVGYLCLFVGSRDNGR